MFTLEIAGTLPAIPGFLETLVITNGKEKMKTRLHLRFIVFMITLGMALVSQFSGCSRGPETGTVSGKVMLGDAPLTLGKIVFIDQVQGAGGSAVLDAEGQYAVTGNIPVGEYKVHFANAMKSGSMDPKDLILTPVQQKYKAADSSGLTFEIKKGKNVANFNLES